MENSKKEKQQDMMIEQTVADIRVYNMICLKNVCPMPGIPVSLEIDKGNNIESIRECKKEGKDILLGIIVDGTQINPIAVLCKNIDVVNVDTKSIKLNCSCVQKARILNIVQREPYYKVEVELIEEAGLDDEITMVYTQNIFDLLYEYQKKCPVKISKTALRGILEINNNPSVLCNAIATTIVHSFEKKIEILNTLTLEDKLKKTLEYLALEIDYLELNEKIGERVKKNMDKAQKEYYLREEMKAITEELGEDGSDIDEIEEKIKKLKVNDEIREKLLADVRKLRKIPSQAPDNTVMRNYLDTVINVPWNEFTEDNFDLKRARQILDEDHSELGKIKDRIIESLACMKLTGKVNGQIICFVGPPGVGKTSIAKSIARALGRKYVRMSLGGIKDEAEIRGHRKTYVGAMPGRIIYNMRLAKVSNPLFLIDEIDKLGSDYKGDPSSAMLEVLDPEQNFAFRDNFMEVPYDLSKVLFIATANDITTIPGPLKDRMEIIELSSYTSNEKLKIAKEHLVKKEMEKHGIKEGQVIIGDDTLFKIIEEYTFEAGVRSLERNIGSIMRKCAVKILTDNVETVTVKPEDLKNMLGAPHKNIEKKRTESEVGVVSGLYYTPLGGGILNIEVFTTEGKGELKITGQLGDVMKESAQIAISVMKGVREKYGISDEKINKTDIHIHVPEGAVKKDGPSAGIALTTALVSQFSGKKVDADLAMTGEIGLRGEVLPIGGLKEKLFACVRSGISKAIVPEFNRDDIEELPDDIKNNLKIYYADSINKVLDIALV